MKQHPRRRSKRRTPAPTLHDLLRQPDADLLHFMALRCE